MQNLKVQMDAPPEVAAGAAGAGGAAAGAGILGTVGRLIKDALILGTVGTAAFVGYYTYAYNNVQVGLCTIEAAAWLAGGRPVPVHMQHINMPAHQHPSLLQSVC